MRAPVALRCVLVPTRGDLRLGLHRLRLEGELTEIRGEDLRLPRDESRALFETAGIRLSDSALALLAERTEGWGRQDCGWRRSRSPAMMIRSGSPPRSPEASAPWLSTYLRRCWIVSPTDVRRLLLRTSVLERVSGSLADLVTGGAGGQRILQQLEDSNRIRRLSGSRGARGFAITTSSPTCYSSSCGVAQQASCLRCMAPPLPLVRRTRLRR